MLGMESRNKTITSTIKGLYGNSKHLWMRDYRSLESELKKAGFKAEEVQVFAHGNKGTRHTIWIAEKLKG